MSKERRLGRGLEALLGRPPMGPVDLNAGPPEAGPDGGDAAAPGDRILWLSVYQIDRNPFQPRQDFDDEAIESLSQSIKEHGMLQPIVVRRVEDRFQLIAGERRLRAATAAGLETVPAQLHEADDRQLAELALIENLQRKDLNALEKAASFQRYIETYGCTQEELAKRVNIVRSTIANLIRLLELPDAVKAAVRSGAVSPGHARALLPLGDEREQIAFCEKIQRDSLSVRVTEEQVQAMIRAADDEPLSVFSPGQDPPKPRPTRSEHLAHLEQQLRSALGTKVDIRQTARGRGRVVVHFKNHDEFERLLTHLAGNSEPGPAVRLG